MSRYDIFNFIKARILGLFFKVIYGSITQGIEQLVSNRLRSILSLLGITIGIFSIISVLSAVDSLEQSILSNFNKLGDNVIYIDKSPWNNRSQRKSDNADKNKEPTFEEYSMLKERMDGAKYISFSSFTGLGILRYGNSEVEGGYMMGISENYGDLANLKLKEGRYFNYTELRNGSEKVILGYSLANSLFQKINPIGKEIKIKGIKYQVVGTIEEDGESMFSVLPYDIVAMVPLNHLRTLSNIDDVRNGRMLGLTPKKGVSLSELKNEAISVLRSYRLLKPLETNNFFINEISMVRSMTKDIFSILSKVGFLIGIFALIVGLFSVANIMFVSVKERTNLIGVKKALGAKSYIILVEFITESIILCLIGGIIGISLVLLIVQLVDRYSSFVATLSWNNLVIGLALSIFTGLLSGIIPAYHASKMDPVEAMRS